PDQICAPGICANVNSTAASLAQKINQSTDYRLQGISAQASAGTVYLFGQYHSDYIDFDGVVGTAVTAKSMGKIFVQGTQWNLPLINTLSANGKVVVLSGPAFAHLNAVSPMLSVNMSILNEIGETASFDAAVNQAGEL